MNKNIFEVDLSAVINFMEGEGYIGFSDGRRNHDNSYNPKFIISNSNKEKLKQIQQILGIGQVKLEKIAKENKKAIYQFRLCVQDIKEFLELIIESKYLIIKKLPALILLNYLKNTTDCGMKKGMSKYGSRVPIEEIVFREQSFKDMTLANKRGPWTKEELEEIEFLKRDYARELGLLPKLENLE